MAPGNAQPLGQDDLRALFATEIRVARLEGALVTDPALAALAAGAILRGLHSPGAL